MGDQDHDDHGVCNTRLELGIGLDNFVHKSKISHHQQHKKTNKSLICLDLSFPFHEIGCKTEEGSSSKTINNGHEDQERQSDTSNNMNNDDNNNGGGNVRKKLRLTKEQSTILEDSFKQHTTLNTAQKQALSEKLKLKPRQVEVWFQNRRARTKLKQTEVDCEFLKKCCENLSEENRRLKKELQDLLSKPSTTSTPFFVQLQKEAAATTTVAVCASCDMKMVRSNKGSINCGGGEIVKHERSMAPAMAMAMAAARDVIGFHKPKHKQNGGSARFC